MSKSVLPIFSSKGFIVYGLTFMFLIHFEFILSHCGVEALSTQEVAGRILGGKAHGSLTHAGKVRGQTLKVVK